MTTPHTDHTTRRALPRAAAATIAAATLALAPLGAVAADEPAGASDVVNGTFDDGHEPWWATENLVDTVDTSTGAMCVDVPGGTVNPWDAIVGQDGFTMPADDYVLSFDVTATTPSGQPAAVRALVQDPVTYATVLDDTLQAGADVTHAELPFTLDQDYTDRQLAFQIGSATDPWTFCLDNVVLEAGKVLPPYAPETGPRVRVNQVGYLEHGPKRATLVTDSASPVTWTLTDADGAVTAEGETEARGLDPASQLEVHTIDFTDVAEPGTYTLTADGEESYEFIIGADALGDLRTDSLAYFYLARSGIEIDAALVGEEYAREPGHVSTAGGSDVNQGDYAVACQPVEESQEVYGEPWTCDYTLDVVGGWYDAGDHGKYVVNGGIATAQLLSTYERTLTAPTAAEGALEDGTLAIPEAGNGIPDVLDEARWELDFMMSMTVPEGEELAGMVHHKVHDYGWTGLPLLPVNDPQERYLHRPSTAATLNLAATAAQGARLFEPFDADYAATLLDAARTAYAAALEHPNLYAPGADGSNGGGPYDDQEVDDEFYWAAAELYLTTGEQEFADAVTRSSRHERAVFSTGGFSWGSVAALGRMDLATVPNDLPDRDATIASVLVGADQILEVQQAEPFGQPLAANRFVWGSNSSILNNIVVLGTAYDLSGDAKYRDAALESLDYLFGRNALNLSYVTGYGDVHAQNQHSRWFAAQLNPELPHPPAGSVAGGPNADVGTWDPVAVGLFAGGCAPQACYVDDIGSWATNEITINWNSALSWVASFAADQAVAGDGADGAGGADAGSGGDDVAAAGGGADATAAWWIALAVVGLALVAGVTVWVVRRPRG